MVNDGRLSGYVHLAAMGDVVARNRSHPGAKLLKPFLEDRSNPTRSSLEDDFRAFVARYGLPTALINVKVNGSEVDAYFPDHGVIVELDSRRYHGDPDSFEQDRDRAAEQLKHGVPTVRITRARMTGSPDREAERLQAILDGQSLS